MSVIIHGLDMPDGCHHCRFSYLDNGETNDGQPCTVLMCSIINQGTNGADYNGNRPSWCPLVPIPEGHGRMGDLDALQEEFKKSHDGKRLMLIDTAPTIIEADLEWKMKNCCCFSNTDQAEGGTDDGD